MLRLLHALLFEYSDRLGYGLQFTGRQVIIEAELTEGSTKI